MTRWNGRILFIDGFAGPGEYSGGEPGSPLIALEAVRDHAALDWDGARIQFLFIEKDVDRTKHLEEVVNRPENTATPNAEVLIVNGSFDETLGSVLDAIEEQQEQLAPSFVMIDPFGVSDTPMALIGKILQNSKSEVYVSFMYRDINRFKNTPEFEKPLDDLFGCPDWRDGLDLEGSAKKNFYFDLYKSQLRKAGARYVLHFELYEGNSLVYAIFFGTQDLEGCDKMKQAIWKVAPFGNYQFRDGHTGQLAFESGMVEFSEFGRQLREEFAGRNWVSIEDLIDFARSDKTHFHSSHLKTKVLRQIEDRGELEVREGTRSRARTYPDNTQLRFRDPPPNPQPNLL